MERHFLHLEDNCYYGVKIENDVICRVKTPQLSYLQENHYYIFEAKDWIYTHGFGHVLFDEERDAEKEGEEKGFPLYTDCELHQQQRGCWHQVFGDRHPIYIEIGMGKGQFILNMAKAHPDVNFIGIERYSSVLLRALEKFDTEEYNIIGVRIYF